MSKAELLKGIAEASAKGDTKEISRLARELVKTEVDEKKLEVAQAVKDNEQMAGARDKLTAELKAEVDKLDLGARLEKVKAFGFVYSVNHIQKSDTGDTKVIGGLALRTPEIAKTKRASTGGNARGSGEFAQATQATGYTPAKAYDEFATAEDKAKMAKAGTSSAQWKIREDVRQREIKAGRIAVK